MIDRPTRGRPREFDTSEALRSAMQLFWQRGFDSTTLPDLLGAMGGISPTSFYAAFKSKEEVFSRAVALYQEEVAGPVVAALEGGKTARASIEAMMREGVRLFAGSGTPPGCLLTLGGLNTANENVKALIHDARCQGEDMIASRLARGVADGDVPATADCGAITAYYSTVMRGLALAGYDGKSRATLNRVIDAAMASWPSLVRPKKKPTKRRA
jgi:AcrR family transcriptional regulator